VNLALLLAHAEQGAAPVLERGIPVDRAAPEELSGPRQVSYLRYDSADPGSLALQRWGVIAPIGQEGDRLLSLVAPLIAARQMEQDAPATIYRVPADMDIEQAIAWRADHYFSEDIREEERPRYLLVLGDLDQVSLSLQQILASDAFIGRLAFRRGDDARSDEEAYEAYTEKVLRFEGGLYDGAAVSPKPVPPEDAQGFALPGVLYYTARDGTLATFIGYQALMARSLEQSRERRASGALRCGEILELGDEAITSTGDFTRLLARPEPSVLFSLSHGLGAPRRGWQSDATKWAQQGALRLGTGDVLTGEDVARGSFLPGGAWLCFACFSAGTPSSSAFRLWLSRLADLGQLADPVRALRACLPDDRSRPFVAALPQRALANPHGPLAFIGHVDLAWTYSFQDVGRVARNRSGRFQGVLRSFVDGGRAGVAHHELLRFLIGATVEIAAISERGAEPDPDAARAVRKAHLWMLHHDLAGFILLGDPAARLPISAQPGVRAGVRDAGRPPPRRDEAAKGWPSVEEMGRAVIDAIGGAEGMREVAARYGVSRADLARWIDAYKAAGQAALQVLRG
jgi:hypothetical protein